MNDKRTDDRLSEDDIADILGKVGARPMPSEDVINRVRMEVHGAWAEEVAANQRRRRWIAPSAIAASVLVAVAAFWTVTPGDEAPMRVASVQRASGEILIRSADGGEWASLGDAIPADSIIRTAEDASVALVTSSGFDIRLDSNSKLRVTDSSRFELDSGAMYADSHNLGQDAIAVTTRFGLARDIGTQFEVRLLNDGWQVQVREGSVAVEDDDHEAIAAAGQRVTIDTAGAVAWTEVPAFDPSWAWAEAAAAAFEIDGITLQAYLDWYARETGTPVRFARDVTKDDAEKTILHGSIDGLSPRASLPVVLATTDFRIVDANREAVVIDR